MSSKIILFNLTADFFTERANKSLEQYNYSKALRYFKRAGEMEPTNPSHFCNIAGVLGYQGKFVESNEVLLRVLQQFDKHAAECHYYVACNYIYLDQLEQAEEHAYLYLFDNPEGAFHTEATEILEYVAEELKRPSLTNEIMKTKDEKTMLHEEARFLMEDGKFQQAEKILKIVRQEYPDFLAAGNNLSLCYYYKGEVEKAYETINAVLRQDPCNIHAMCNLAILYYQQQDMERLAELVAELRKIIPIQYDQAYKLGITLGVLGDHSAAYQLFKKMSVYAWELDFHLYHYCAVSAYNLGDYSEAKKYWKLVLKEDPGSTIALYYLDLTDHKDTSIVVPYYYQVPHHYKKEQQPLDSIYENMERDPFVRSSFLWALRNGDRETKLQVLQAFEWLGDQEVIEVLKEFVANPEEEEDLKEMAKFILNTIAQPGAEGEKQAIRWQQIWKDVVSNLREELTKEQKDRAHRLWKEFILTCYPKVPKIQKPEAWAAALEYLAASITFKDVAESYGVSIQTVKQKVEKIRSYKE